ncbi:MAG: Fic domain protein, Mvan_2529 type, partial [uncultured Quadrisphaera sp.]
MAEWRDALWESRGGAPSRADRRSGRYRTYAPDPLTGRSLRLEPDVSELARLAEDEVRRLGERPGSRGVEALSRFLLRSEAIASSRIEGLRVSPQQVGLAEQAEEEGLPRQGAGETARLVAANIA